MQENILYKVNDYPDLLRRGDSKAIINNDTSSLNKYKEERAKQQKLNKIIEENDMMKSDIAEIKTLLKTFLGQNNR
jgi:hypothetical protein